MGDVTVASTTDSQELVNQAAGGVDQQDTEIEERPVPTGDVQVENEPEEATPPPEPEPSKKEEKPVPRGVEKRIDKLVRQNKELEARLLAFESRQSAPPPPPFEAPPAPVPVEVSAKFDTFDSWSQKQVAEGKTATLDDFLEERDAWKEARQAQQQERDYQMEVEKQINTNYNEKMAAFRAEHDDWEEVVGQNIEILPAVGRAIVENSVPEVAYFLGQHPEEIKKLNAMTPFAAVAYVGKLAAKLENTEEEAPAPTNGRSPDRQAVVSRAPSPIKPLTGHAVRNSVDLNDPNLSFEQYRKIRDEQEKNRYRR